MIKALLALIIAGLAAVVIMTPAPLPPALRAPVAVDPPAVSVCPVDEGSGLNTTVGIVATVDAEGRFTAFAGGSPAGEASFETGVSGAAAIPLVDVAPIGVAAGLVELPVSEAASASLVVGAESLAHESCLTSPAPQTLLGGGSSVSGEEFEVQLMNPYSGEALVDLTVVSESGIESASQLQAIAVPSRSSAVIDLDEVLPGRQSLAVTVDSLQGSVMAVGRLASGTDSALWNAVPPAQDWFVPIPTGSLGDIVIMSGAATEVEFQIDLYGANGLTEAFQAGSIPPRGTTVVDAPESEAGPSAVRVVSAQPVAVFLRTIGDTGVGFTTGSSTPATRWLLPAAGLGPGVGGRLVIVNTGLDEVTATITAVREASVAQQITVPAGTVIEVPAVEGGADAYTVSGDGLVVASWATLTGTASAFSAGVPLVDE